MDAEQSTGPTSEWLRWAMDHLEGQVGFGDTKAGLLLTADSILLAALLTLTTSDRLGVAEMSGGAVVLVALSFAALVGALLLALLTILPSRPNLVRPDVHGRGLTNFAAIASIEQAEFLDRLAGSSAAELDRDAARSVYGKASWARRKFVLLYRAIALTMAAVVLAAVAVAVEVVVR